MFLEPKHRGQVVSNERGKISAYRVERPEAVSQQGDLLASIFILSNCFRKKERKGTGWPGQVSLLHLVTASHRVRKYLGRQSQTSTRTATPRAFSWAIQIGCQQKCKWSPSYSWSHMSSAIETFFSCWECCSGFTWLQLEWVLYGNQGGGR